MPDSPSLELFTSFKVNKYYSVCHMEPAWRVLLDLMVCQSTRIINIDHTWHQQNLSDLYDSNLYLGNYCINSGLLIADIYIFWINIGHWVPTHSRRKFLNVTQSQWILLIFLLESEFWFSSNHTGFSSRISFNSSYKLVPALQAQFMVPVCLIQPSEQFHSV